MSILNPFIVPAFNTSPTLAQQATTLVPPQLLLPPQNPSPIPAGPGALDSFAAPQADSSEEALGAIAVALTAALASVASSLTGGNQAPPSPASVPGAVPPGSAALAAEAKAANITADPQQQAEVDSIIDSLAQDPEGSILLRQSLDNGTTIEIGDAGDGNNGVYIPAENRIIVSPNAQDGIAKTLVHELVHSATKGDGNSQDEEGLADAIAFRVGERAGLLADNGLTTQQEYEAKKQLYGHLEGTNDIRNSLASLGIDASSIAQRTAPV